MSPLLQKEARLFASFQLSVPSYTMEERKNWWYTWKVELITYEGNRISTHTPSVNQRHKENLSERKHKCKCKCKELLMWTTPTRMHMQTQSTTQGTNKFSFSWACICVCFPHVNRQKINHCRPSWKNTSAALAYLSFLAFALDVWTRLHFYLRLLLRLHLHRTCEPVFRTFHGMTYL